MLPQLVSPDAGTFRRRDVWRSKFYTGDINLCRNWGGALIGACINCLLSSIERFHSRDQHLCKFIGTRESIYKRKEINSHRTGLEHQCGRCDFMQKRSIICKDHCAESTKKHLFLRNIFVLFYIHNIPQNFMATLTMTERFSMELLRPKCRCFSCKNLQRQETMRSSCIRRLCFHMVLFFGG